MQHTVNKRVVLVGRRCTHKTVIVCCGIGVYILRQQMSRSFALWHTNMTLYELPGGSKVNGSLTAPRPPVIVTHATAMAIQARGPSHPVAGMVLPLWQPTRRLRAKTARLQEPLPAALELESEAPAGGNQKAYLVTLTRPTPGAVSDGRPLEAPDSMSK